MRNRLEEAKSDLINKAAAVAERGAASRGREDSGGAAARAGDDHQARAALLRRYYRHVAPEDLVDRNPVDVYGAAASHWRTAEYRPQGVAVVNVFTPTVDEHGWSCGRTVVEIVTDDMPFLVDSVTMALNHNDNIIHVVMHPQIVVRRDVAGTLLEVCDYDENDPRVAETPDAIVESWMHVEIDRHDDPEEQHQIEQLLLAALRDVRDAVEDWQRMRQRCEEIADSLDAERLPIDAEDVEEARQLLRWLADDHFTFLGYREYVLDDSGSPGDDVLRPVTGTGLGILRADQELSGSFAKLPPEVRAKARERELLVLTKANSKATVHRSAYLDYIGVKVFDDEGNVTGERRFLGLFTSAAYIESVLRIPVLRRRVQEVIRRSGFAPTSHSGKDLIQVLETYPRDELFQTSAEELFPIALAVVNLQERRQLRMFVRRDDYGRYLSFLVYLPRDRYNTDVRERIQRLLLDATGGGSIDFTARVGESVLARLHFVVRKSPEQPLPDIDAEELERQLAAATRAWTDDFSDALAEQIGEESAARLLRRYKDGFPEGYKEDFPARTAAADVRRLEELPDVNGLALNLYQPVGAPATDRRLKIYRTGSSISLTQVLPVLSRMGVEVVDERPYEIHRHEAQTAAHIYDFGLRFDGVHAGDGGLKELFQEAFVAVWRGDAESDGFNALVPKAGLSWREASILRAYAKYLRQAGSTFSQNYLEECLTAHVDIARQLVELFKVRFEPDRHDDEERAQAMDQLTQRIETALDHVASLDQDRILRSFLGLIQATLRTSFFRSIPAADGGDDAAISFKLDPRSIPDLPEPRPRHEIWVYSPRLEGVHLRYGAVARGGLRWSDRREDFRTEILGLVKAQAVKNSVIVPVGAKGGFVGKRLPDPSIDRDAWLAEGVECYKTFIRGMLDITDNRADDGTVLPPERVVRHDGDDPYLVVAADKGTAAFSDIANDVSKEYGFWLGDAFASGGSAGYDHKAMGITARGAWESVKRHFREMGRDSQSEDFTVVGIGDMSGDVFGNGMLLSEHIRLVAAFDHRHIFLDPDPDPATSYAERRRLFEQKRSTWEDYTDELISEGGGIFSRSSKSVPVTPQVAERLGVDASVTSMTPAELVRAILCAPVDLLWNGGIGTYVKASTETHAQVGDKANDAVRVDATDLRCRSVVEGGNLGLTQRARIEYAVRATDDAGREHAVNTDWIDNSGGVDVSDHEVNIKILLDSVVRSGDMTEKQRNALLAEMTDEVSELVLATNYRQNVALANSEHQASNLAHVHRAYINKLEHEGLLDRTIEALPTDRQMHERMNAGRGLTAPELAVLLAYTKNVMYDELVPTSLPDDPYLSSVLHAYFPSPIRERYPDRIDVHPLRREIITTTLVNELVDQAGTTFAFRLGMETGGSMEDLARAHTVASVVFKMPELYAAVAELDNLVPAEVQTRMRLAGRTITERVTRWLVTNRRPPIDIAWQISFFEAPIARLLDILPDVLAGRELDLYSQRRDELIKAGVPQDLAVRVAVLPPAYSGLGMVENSLTTGTDLVEVARTHFILGDHLGLGRLLERIIALPRNDRWQTMARAALRDDLHAVHAALTAQVLQHTDENDEPERRVQSWAGDDEVMVSRTRRTIGEVVEGDAFDLARLSVGVRVVRSLLRSSPA
ncbi:NAD-glutamate dehydrogenase [Actinobacteria bacterium YIM 96077]|uniref:NAD-glutamate dehydrogenase n=1 Tax=Phytoactinopolyspora halophila TaxID=1981511 RepID=A0A329R3X6_9ACTN|nr:NAD-glutamate dehydrogenase [Phytoactinopolyspora halophila]AYY15247.1 NAD-glutamate dehydrogenase [Actinobacteria bacterium YIM 96077]RAW18686.1 NAD-glutamate dehydrogenase [Phytoactinopolyspora halophila]